MDSDTLMLVVAVLVVILVVGAGLLLYRQMQSRKLAERFGPEYKRTVRHFGSQTKAEEELKARAARVEKLKIVPLSAADCDRFRNRWEAVQALFVDDPRGANAEADKLVREVMTKRGYPMGDFARRAADISVDHPVVVEHYRAAQQISDRDARGEATTEDLRKAVVHYRALFVELLEAERAEPQPNRSTHRVQRA